MSTLLVLSGSTVNRTHPLRFGHAADDTTWQVSGKDPTSVLRFDALRPPDLLAPFLRKPRNETDGGLFDEDVNGED